jgi:hypothetical protein
MSERRARVVALSPDVDPVERESDWLVLGGDARFVACCVELPGRVIESPSLGMIRDYLGLLDLVRHEPEADDDPALVERWRPVDRSLWQELGRQLAREQEGT